MAGNVIYADLNIPEARLPCSPQPHNFRQCPRWHPLILKIGVAGYVVLLVAVLVLSVLLFQGSSDSGVAPEDGGISERPRNESKCITSLENLSDLKQHLCDPPQSSSTVSPPEGAKCVLCPRDWLPYKGKCYWVSKETKRWTSSHEDCLMKRSHLLVTQDLEELIHIVNLTPSGNLFGFVAASQHQSSSADSSDVGSPAAGQPDLLSTVLTNHL